MCGICGIPQANADWFAAGVDRSQPGWLRARAELARAGSRFFEGEGVLVRHCPGSSTLSMHNSTGATVTVRSLSEMVPAVQKGIEPGRLARSLATFVPSAAANDVAATP